MKRISGAGGGGLGKDKSPAQHIPVEAADTLRSSSYAQVIDLVSEGEIEGLVNGSQSVYLNETPLQNSDGTYNFSGVTLNYRYGTQAQAYIPGQADVENEISVGVDVLFATPVVRTISNTNVDAVRVTVTFPQMTLQDLSSGDLNGTSVNFAIDIQSNGAGYAEKLNATVTGKSTSKYQRSYRIQLVGGAPYDVRVRRITADAVASNLQNKTTFTSYTEIENVKLRYPNSAIMAMMVDAQQFSSIPSRAYDLKLLRIKVPTNYNPTTRVYTGTWDGTFQIAWTDNPAWIFYDLLTSTRYGLGSYIATAQVDKWTLYSVGKYCDELVADGYGGFEPRFVCNLYLQTRAEAYKVINDMASIFRGMVYWAAGSITVSQDAPQDAAFLFTQANVIEGLFTYQGASAKNRHTVALVTWNDPNDFYRQKIEYVEDADAISRYGAVETQVVAMGCTTRGQAHRLGQWILYTEKYQTETVAFQTGLDGAMCRPGQVIKIADPVRAGERTGGRIVSATTTAVTVDSTVPLAVTASLTLSVMLPDGTVEEKAVSSIVGLVITVSSAFSSAPQAGAIWMVANTTVEPQEFRVITVSESKPGIFDISALAHNASKFDAIDNGTVLQVSSITSLNPTPSPPDGLAVTETLYAVGKDVKVKVTVSWSPATGAASYSVQYRKDLTGNLISLGDTGSNEMELLNAEPGFYEFWVTSVSAVGKRSASAYITKTVIGRSLPPIQVQNFSMIPNAGMAYLSWDQASDLDVLIGGSVRIRHTPHLITPSWKNSVDIIPALPGSATRAQAPLLSGTYMAKFVDSSGVPSDSESVIETTIPSALLVNAVATVTEDPGWTGTYSSMEYSADLGGIALVAGLFVDDEGLVDSLGTWDYGGGAASSGSYLFANSVDLSFVYTSRVTVAIIALAFDVGDLFDSKLDNMDDWLDLDGVSIDDVNAATYLRSTEDDPASGGAVWTDWKPFFVSDYRARGFQFKIAVSNTSATHNLAITGLSVSVDMPDRVINYSSLVSGAGTYVLTYEGAYKAVPALGVTGQNMNTGDYYVISSNTTTGFSITFRNAAGTAVSRTFDVIAKGYGRVGT